ncbi:hypothetical protein CK203_116112 [Vitis vinifera]|uniref:Uncharacterized protein n=1 Tax=Vitis vinifera TaxID=29760 RepID=A0A438EH85_VITVI|nr:hypothetical protein CK203_116112 [Vitis vinifera]
MTVLEGGHGYIGDELLIGPATFVTVFQVLRIPTSFNLLLGRPWITSWSHSFFLHLKVKLSMMVRSSWYSLWGHVHCCRAVLEISHTDDDLFMTGFTFDEVQTVEIEISAGILWPCPLTSMGAQWCSILCGACPIYPAWGWVDVSMDRASSSPFLIMTYHLGWVHPH